jgi:hypothetical protein
MPIFTLLLQKREETNIAASTISNIDIVDPAVKPKIPLNRRSFYLILGFIRRNVGYFRYLPRNISIIIKDADMVKRA